MVSHRPRMSSKLSSRRGNAKTPYVCHKPPPIGPIIYPPPPPPPPPPPVCPPASIDGHLTLDAPEWPYSFDGDYSALLWDWDPLSGRAQYVIVLSTEPYLDVECLLERGGGPPPDSILNLRIILNRPPFDEYIWEISNHPWTWCTHHSETMPPWDAEGGFPAATAAATAGW